MSASATVACACCRVELPRQSYGFVDGTRWRWRICEACRSHTDKPGSCRNNGAGVRPDQEH